MPSNRRSSRQHSGYQARLGLELMELVDALGSSISRSRGHGQLLSSAPARVGDRQPGRCRGELTSPAWDEPGRPIRSRALDDVTAFDEITRIR
jgi:hypothetical protein